MKEEEIIVSLSVGGRRLAEERARVRGN